MLYLSMVQLRFFRRSALRLNCLLAVLLTMLSSCLPSVLAKGSDQRAVKMYNLGLNAFKSGSPESAIVFFKRAVELDRTLVDARHNLGVLYMSASRFQEALYEFEEAAKLAPADPDIRRLLNSCRQKVSQTGIAPDIAQAKGATLVKALGAESAPAGIAVDSEGVMWVADFNGNCIVNLESGKTIGDFAGPVGLASDKLGRIFVVNRSAGSVAKVHSDGSRSTILIGLLNPMFIAFDSSGDLYVSDNTDGGRVYRVPENALNQSNRADLLKSYAVADIGGMTVDQGYILVSHFTTGTIGRLDTKEDGNEQEFIINPLLKGALGLYMTEDLLLVPNLLSGSVYGITGDGGVHEVASGLRKPYIIASDSQGHILVTTEGDSSVWRLTSELLKTPPSAVARAGRSPTTSSTSSPTGLSPGERATKPAAIGQSDSPVRDKWALVIGISKFANPSYNLKYAAKDAKDFCLYLLNEGNFKKDHVLLLLDEKATRKNIMTAFGDKFLPAVSEPDDLVVVFVSTHGTPSAQDKGGRNYIVAYDTDVSELYATGVDMDEIYRRVKEGVRTDRALIVMDTCYSGAGVPGSKGLHLSDNFDVNQIAQGCGHLVITSSSPNERSWESKVSRNGIFTKYLIEALKSKKQADLKETFQQMKEKVTWEVKSCYGQPQSPQLGGDWKGKGLVLSAPPSKPRTNFSTDLMPFMVSAQESLLKE